MGDGFGVSIAYAYYIMGSGAPCPGRRIATGTVLSRKKPGKTRQ